MLKVRMEICTKEGKALVYEERVSLFFDNEEMSAYIEEGRRFGEHISVESVEYISAFQMFSDSEFEYSYRVEMLYYSLYGEENSPKRWYDMERILKRKEII